MKTIGVIPARFASTRLPAKVLALIQGRPMIEHVYRQAKKSRLLNEVYIACDDQRVMDAAVGFGARAIMTSPNHTSGTDRITEAVGNISADIILNIQGDEPLLHPDMIDILVQGIHADSNCVMATVARRITDSQDLMNPNVVKVVINQNGDALYFSRSAIPFNRDRLSFSKLKYYKHFGIYAYRKSFLLSIKNLPFSMLEQSEKLEQLRVLESGHNIKVVITEHDTISVDTQDDLNRVETFLDANEA